MIEHDQSFAIVCRHVTSGELPALRAARDEPVDEQDSGWQIHCDTVEEHDEDDAIVMCLACVAERWPDLAPHLEEPAPLELARSQDRWRKLPRTGSDGRS